MVPDNYRPLGESSQGELKWSGLLWLIFSATAIGLGNSLEPISALVFVHPFLFVVGFEKLFHQISNVGFVFGGYDCDLAITCLIAAFLHGCGMTIGFAGLFGYPSNTFGSVLATFVASLLWWITIVSLTMVPFHFALSKHPSWTYTPLVFAVCHTAASVSVLGELVGTFCWSCIC